MKYKYKPTNTPTHITKYKYKQIDISTPAGLRNAEQYQSQGWKIVNVSTTTVLLEKEVKIKID